MGKKKANPAKLVEQANEDFVLCSKCNAAIFDGMCNCGLTQGNVEQVAKAMDEQKNEVPADTEEGPPVFSAKEALKQLPNAPSEAQIEAWKSAHGAVYTFPFDTKEIYLWRPLRRREWQEFQTNQALMQNESMLQEHVVRRAVLWPQLGPVEMNLTRAGLVQTLYSVIMQGSYFLHPDFALTLVEQI